MRLTFVQSETDNGTSWRQDWSWDDVATFLTTHRRLPAKGELGVIFARFADGPCRRLQRAGKCTEHCPGNDHRIDENVETVTALGLDFDDAPHRRLEELIIELRRRGVRHLWYTTWGSTPAAPKIRVVIALDAEVPRDQFRGFWDAVVDDLGIRDIVDTKCRNPGRLFFTPQCPADGVPSAEASEGAPFATRHILASVPAQPIESPNGAEFDESQLGPASPELMAHALARLNALGPAVAGKGGNAHTRAAWGILVNDLALSPAEARAVFRVWDLGNQPPWGDDAFAGPCRDDQQWSAPRGGERERIEAATSGVDIFGTVPPRPSDEYGRPLVEYMGADDPGDADDEWLQHGLVAAGVPQVIAGHPKSYKTFLLEYLCLCTAMGVDAFGKFTHKRSRVLMLPREDAERETRRRVWRLARGICHQQGRTFNPAELEGWLTIDSLKPFYWTEREHVQSLINTIERRQLGLIMVDSLSRTHSGDENSVKDMAPVVNTWADICLRTGVAVPIIHHFTKSGSGTLLQQLRGSGSIGAVVRHLIGVEKALKRGDAFRLTFEGNLRGLPDAFKIKMADSFDSVRSEKYPGGAPIITFTRIDSENGEAQESVESLASADHMLLVVQALRNHELRGVQDGRRGFRMLAPDVRKAAGMGMNVCEAALEAARDEHLVEYLSKRGWGLTAAGRVFADN